MYPITDREKTLFEAGVDDRFEFLTEDPQGIGEIIERLETTGNELSDKLFRLYEAGAANDDAKLLAAARELYFLLDATADDMANGYAYETLLAYR